MPGQRDFCGRRSPRRPKTIFGLERRTRHSMANDHHAQGRARRRGRVERQTQQTSPAGTRMAEVIPVVALLSTGDELINGDVFNTNSPTLAQRLRNQFIQPGLHLTASDDQAELERAMRFLLNDHPVLICTGGLGPTSDDRTRFALAATLQQELVFDEVCWEAVKERLSRLSLPIPDTNRQQCLFPAGAEIYPNDNGTAAACRVTFGQQQIFMLPGPPFECLPIFEKHVLPYLLAHQYARPLCRQEWLLLGVSEGSIAELLDPLMAGSLCQVGYRVNQPYLEVKLHSPNATALARLAQQFEALIGAKSVSANKQKASAQLLKFILEKKCHLNIIDHATGGLLAVTLLTPESYHWLSFSAQNAPREAIQITVSGLANYWQQQQNSGDLEILIDHQGKQHHITRPVPFRSERTRLFAMEIACWAIFQYLSLKPW